MIALLVDSRPVTAIPVDSDVSKHLSEYIIGDIGIDERSAPME